MRLLTSVCLAIATAVFATGFLTPAHAQTRKEKCHICIGRGESRCTYCNSGTVTSTDLSGHTYRGSCRICGGDGDKDCPYCTDGWQIVWDSTFPSPSPQPSPTKPGSPSRQRLPEKSNAWIWIVVAGVAIAWFCFGKGKS